MKIGFIGLGFMGGNMAARVLAGGFELRVHDLDRGKAASLLAGGAAWADSAQACADGVDLLITSLPGPKQCRAVMLDGGTIDAFKPGAIWCDMTTNERDLVAEIARRADARGVTVLDAPVTGAVDGARLGRLTIFAGGEGAAIDRIQPVLDCMGQTIRCGALGTGNAVKLARSSRAITTRPSRSIFASRI